VCERPACEAKKGRRGGKAQCCSCADVANLQETINRANLLETTSEATLPSFMEIMNQAKFQEQAGKPLCCACAKK